MEVAIITPYFREPLETLRACHQSVRGQTQACAHFMVADGFPQPEISNWAVQHLVLAKSHADVGNTPRGIGSLSAMNQGFDAIAYLDADNWYYPNHVDAMIKLHQQTGAAVCTASRTIHRLDGSLLFPDRADADGCNHVDTSCYFLTRQAFRLLPIWATMPKELGPAGDRLLWEVIRILGLPCAHHREPTVAFRTQYESHYRYMSATPPPGAKTNQGSADKAIKWWNALPQEVRDDWQRRMGFMG